MYGRRHRLAGDLGIAVGDRDRAFLVQAEQHLRPLIAEIIDEAVVQPAIAGPRIEGDIGDVSCAQRIGHNIAAEARGVDARRHRTIEGGQARSLGRSLFDGFVSVARHVLSALCRPGGG